LPKVLQLILDKYGDILNNLKDFYFDYAWILIDKKDSQITIDKTKIPRTSLEPADVLSEEGIETAFFYLFTAAALGHPRARVQYATYFLQNALLPSKEILRHAIYGSDSRGPFYFLKYVSPDLQKFIDSDQMTDVFFMKEIVQSEATM